ncbi:BrnT family toxin [Methylobacter sp.]|uniref:BrnT family toxin n=2 Tax=Methylobacter sp. TaxID=2051955 RepID=UPI002FE0FC9C
MAHSIPMNFKWDENKSGICFDQPGFDSAYVVQAFIDPNRLIKKDNRWDYAEDRYQLLGSIAQRMFCIVYTLRGSTIRIISARKANQREVNRYENSKNEY